jgi:hypothetical protein
VNKYPNLSQKLDLRVLYLADKTRQRTAIEIIARIRQLLKQYGHLPPTSLDNLEAEFTDKKV